MVIDIKTKVFMAIISLIGLAMLFWSISLFFQYRKFLNTSKKTYGELVEYGMFRIGAGPSHGYYTPKIRFLSDTGKEFYFSSKVGFTPWRKKFDNPKKIPVIYDPKNPNDAEIDSKLVHFVRLFLPMLGGLFFLGIGLFSFFY